MQGQVINPVAYAGIIAAAYKPTMKETLATILKLCCEGHGVKIEDVVSPSRLRALSYCRSNFCFLARARTGATLMEVGEFINRDHSTVIYKEKQHLNLLSYKDYASLVMNVERLLKLQGVITHHDKPEGISHEDLCLTYNDLLNRASEYSMINRDRLAKAVRLMNGNDDEDVRKYAKIVRLVMCDVAGSTSPAAKAIGIGKSTLHSCTYGFRRDVKFDKSIRSDYEQLKAML